MAQTVKHLPTMRETWVWSLGQEVPLEKEMATHSSILAWKIPGTEESGRLQSMRSQRVGHDWATSLRFTSLYAIFIECLIKNILFYSHLTKSKGRERCKQGRVSNHTHFNYLMGWTGGYTFSITISNFTTKVKDEKLWFKRLLEKIKNEKINKRLLEYF